MIPTIFIFPVAVPGDPLESEGSDWEKVYLDWLRKIEELEQQS